MITNYEKIHKKIASAKLKPEEKIIFIFNQSEYLNMTGLLSELGWSLRLIKVKSRCIISKYWLYAIKCKVNMVFKRM